MENAVIGILIPFAGTSLGAACVYAMKQELDRQVQRGLTGFASGVMIAASIWSLLIPAMEEAAPLGKFAFVPAVAGFWLGIFLLLALDRLVPHLHMYSEKAEGPHSHLQRTTMLVLAVTLHNIPEGMAVGVVYAGLLAGQTGISAAGALALSLGIALQNLPEGAIISMPLKAARRRKAQSLSRRRPVGHRRTHRGGPDHCPDGLHRTGPALSPQPGCRCHVLCRRRRTHPGNVGRRTL